MRRALLSFALLAGCFSDPMVTTGSGSGTDAGTGSGSTSGDTSTAETSHGTGTTGSTSGTSEGDTSGSTSGGSGSSGGSTGDAGSTSGAGSTGSTGSGSTGGWGAGPWYQPCDACQPGESCIVHLGGREVCSLTSCELDSDCPPSAQGAQCRNVWDSNPGSECSIPCQGPNGPCPQGMVCTTINATGFCIWENP